MHALLLAAVLAAAPQAPGQATRDIVLGVCLPFIETGAAPADNIALAGLARQAGGGEGDLQTANGHHLVKLTHSAAMGDNAARRVCEVQARAGGLAQARDAISGPLRTAGFDLAPDEPEDWPVWTRGGVTVTAHQNPGRATIVRVRYSASDDDAS